LDRDTYATGTECHDCAANPPLAFTTASVEPLVCDLTGGACPFRERAWQAVAALIRQTASGVIQGVRRALTLAGDQRLWGIHRLSISSIVEIPTQLFEDWCG